jgi:hypothetical protein
MGKNRISREGFSLVNQTQSALIDTEFANRAPLVFKPQEWFEEHYPPNQPSEMPQDERKQGRQGNHKG